MRTLLIAGLLFPLALLAEPTHVVEVHLTNNTGAQMHYETLTIGHDTRVIKYPSEHITTHTHPLRAVILKSPSDRWAISQMTYDIDLPLDKCGNREPCVETVLLNWQTNMGFEGSGDTSLCGVSGKDFEPLEHVSAYCTIPMIDPRDPERLHIHYFFDYL